MSDRLKNMLIVGGGIAGLTLAGLLRKSGIEIDLIERADEWKPIGAGITLGMNAMGILARIGLAERLIENGQVIHVGRLSDQRGRALSRMDFHPLAKKFGVEAVALHRADLHDALLEAIDSSTTNVRLGTTLKSLENGDDCATVEFSDGKVKRYDLVVGADGINSQVRSLAFGEFPLRYSGYTCWRFIIEPVFTFDSEMTTEMWGRGKRFGIVPISRERLYCFTTLNAARQSPDYQNISVEKFRNLYKEFGWMVPDILQAISSPDQLIHNDLEDVYVEQWHEGRSVLIGDAAHALTPNLGQGAAMAIEDAYVLANELNRCLDIRLALRKYADSRRSRVDAVHRQSYRLGRLAQWESLIACSLRNLAFRLSPDSLMSKNVEKLLGGAPPDVSA